MREPAAGTHPFGLLAEFGRPERLVEAVRRTRAEGFSAFDAYSPYPIEEMKEALEFKENIIPWLTFAGGLAGAAVGFGMQLYTNWDFPIEIGGRPIEAWQPFMLITFELTVLFSVLATIIGMLLLNRLPRLHHPVFDVREFHLASTDKFFLIIFANDERFEGETTRQFLLRLDPLRISLVGKTEEPE
jgi:hypothetical protein